MWHDWRTLSKEFGMPHSRIREILSSTKNQNTQKIMRECEFDAQIDTEEQWIKLGRPYYNVHPRILQAMVKTRLDNIPSSELEVPGELHAVLVRLTGSQKCVTAKTGEYIKSIMMGYAINRTMCLLVDTSKEGLPHLLWIKAKTNMSCEELVNDATEHIMDYLAKEPTPQDAMRFLMKAAIKVVITCRFIHNCPSEELIQFDVLSKYRDEYTTASEMRRRELEDKSIRRGKRGWNIGCNELIYGEEHPFREQPDYESSGRELENAHIRSGHLHIVRFGAGKRQLKVQYFRPTIVRPDLPFRE